MPNGDTTQHLKRAWDIMTMRLWPSIVPIYGINREGLLAAAGSAILLHFRRREYYLITAGHVSDQNRYTTLFTFGSSYGLIPLDAHGVTTAPNGIRRGLDKLDVSALMLKRSTVRELGKMRNIDFASWEILWRTGLTRGWFGFLGYPAERNQPRYQTPQTLCPTIDRHFASFKVEPAPLAAYSRIGCAPETHFVARFNHRSVFSDDEGFLTLHPAGMSGGALVFYGHPNDVLRGFARPFICGIGIEYHEEERLIVGTRSNVIFDLLSQLRLRHRL